MTERWYTSDLHFLHRRVAYSRGFVTPAEHDEAIITNWNELVGAEDVIWVLGDVAFGSLSRWWPLAGKLHGTRHLITGNHDAPWPAHRNSQRHQAQWLAAGVFASVQPWALHRINGTEVALSHFPYAGEGDRGIPDRHGDWRLRPSSRPLIHGHVHTAHRGDRHQVHAGLDAWDLRPAHYDQIAGILQV